jgi:NAD(P)-dependent dehydrogenase (short-subunit alcohol dehydrogenase family)
MRAERQCLKRRLEPEDVARVALFLASEESGGITAQCHVVDGGWA